MNEPTRTQWEIRCAFNGFCKRVLKNEALDTQIEVQENKNKTVVYAAVLGVRLQVNIVFYQLERYNG